MRFSYGIEHEVAFIRGGDQFVDWTNASFADFDRLIALLPVYPGDYPQLHVGDAGIRLKRWYIEGIERLSERGELVTCVPKGIEIRTTRHPHIAGVVQELRESFAALRQVAALRGWAPVCTSFNPFQTEFVYDPPLTLLERQLHREAPELQTDSLAMLTYGPDLNLSLRDVPVGQAIELGRKLVFYSPFMVPWSFSAPFYAGRTWDGLSVRTFLRSGNRSAVRVFVEHEDQVIPMAPVLTKLARSAHEVGRIEFKAFDSCGDFALYGALLALLKGLVLDTSLPGRADAPDVPLHQVAARQGFSNGEIRDGARQVLAAAEAALRQDPDLGLLGQLRDRLTEETTPAHALRRAYARTGSVVEALRDSC